MNAALTDYLAALRSGEYNQVRNMLITGTSRAKGYCCLGVLCLVDPDIKQHFTNSGLTFVRGDESNQYSSVPPLTSVEKLELPEQMVEHTGGRLGIELGTILVMMEFAPINERTKHILRAGWRAVHILNDTHKLTFDEIADMIEKTYNHLTQ